MITNIVVRFDRKEKCTWGRDWSAPVEFTMAGHVFVGKWSWFKDVDVTPEILRPLLVKAVIEALADANLSLRGTA